MFGSPSVKKLQSDLDNLQSTLSSVIAGEFRYYRKLNTKIDNMEVKEMLKKIIHGEEFLDAIVKRIKSKQL